MVSKSAAAKRTRKTVNGKLAQSDACKSLPTEEEAPDSAGGDQAGDTEVDATLETTGPTSQTAVAKGSAAKSGKKRQRSESECSVEEGTTSEPVYLKRSAKQTQAAKRHKTNKELVEKDQDNASDVTDSKGKSVTNKTTKAPTEGPRKWRKDWKDWIGASENRSSEKFDRSYEEDLVNIKESAKIYGIKTEDLACLPHCPVQNPHGRGFTPMKFYLKADVVRLAFRKEAVLAGVTEDDEDELLAHGKELYEKKNGPVDELFELKMDGSEPAMNRYY